MISVVICSVNKVLLDVVSKNIERTIGTAFEIIAVDNSKHNEGICRVYNKGAALAKYPFVCFVHEDVLFETQDWGTRVVEHFNDKRIGLIGIAGGDTKSVVPTSWSTSFYNNEINLVQHNWTGKIFNNDSTDVVIQRNETKKYVVAVDGVFMCTRKSLLTKYQFDEQLLKGFHGYDIDFSLQLFGQYNTVVVNDILLHHFSEGVKNNAWLESAFAISKKWKDLLPYSAHPLTLKQVKEHHWKAMQIFLTHLFLLDYSMPVILKHFAHYSFGKNFHFRRFLSMCKFIVTAFNEKKRNNTCNEDILKTVLNYS